VSTDRCGSYASYTFLYLQLDKLARVYLKYTSSLIYCKEYLNVGESDT